MGSKSLHANADRNFVKSRWQRGHAVLGVGMLGS